MAFEKGKSGNPGGRPKAKDFTDALRVAVLATEGDKTKLRKIAEKLADMAVEGDIQAIKEIGNRLEGTPAQTIHATTEQVDSFASLTIEQLAARTADTLRRIEEAASRDGVADTDAEEHPQVRTVN